MKERIERDGDSTRRLPLHSSSKTPVNTKITDKSNNNSTLKETAPSTSTASTASTPAPAATPSIVRYADLTMLLNTSNNVLDAIQSVALSKLGIQNEFLSSQVQ